MTNDKIYNQLKQCITNGESVALATVIEGPGLGEKLLLWLNGKTLGGLGSDELEKQVSARALRLLSSQHSAQIAFRVGGKSIKVFIEVFPPPLKLIIIGAVHIARSLLIYANELGFHTTVIDARGAFATKQRFPHADELIIRWPADALSDMKLDEATYLVFLSHDEKLDNPALAITLKSRARYIGALGAAQTHARRVQALKAMGFTDDALARIHAPIGLDLGAGRPEEIAVSIIAQIVSVKQGGSATVSKTAVHRG